ncbi:FAR1 DNA-binding domain [Sesbania bispinosa]|nr:FAR1 DNA-binding domain [Sesbania bispinosa]
MEMELNSDDSAVNLDDDRDFSYSDSSSSSDDENHNQNDRVIDFEDEVNEEEVDTDEGNEAMDAEVGGEVSRRIIDLTSDDIWALEFYSENDAFNFYFYYARCHGFAVRRDDVIKDNKGMLIMRQFLCSRAGFRDKKHLIRLDRKKEHRPLTRTNCQAKLRVRFDYKTGKFKVISFLDSHNHELTPAKFVPLMPASHGLSDGDKAQVDALHSHGVRPCQIMGFLVDQKGGYRNVGFSKKDLYNYIDEVKRADGLDKVEPDMMRVCRFVLASSHYNIICDMVSQKREHFKQFIGDIMKLKQKYENLCSVSSTSTVEINVVHDPTMVKTKGAPTKARKRRKRKRCSNFQASGHVITTCPRLVPPEDEVNINHEVSGAESESLMRDADKSEEGIAFDHNVTDRSSNHISRRISHSLDNASSSANSHLKKKKMKSLSQLSDSVCVSTEDKHNRSHSRAKQGRHGPKKSGADLKGPSPKPEKEVQQHGSVIPTTENATTVPIGFPTNMCAPTLNNQLPRGGPSSVGNIHIREDMSITLPYPNSSQGNVMLPNEGSCLAHGLFPLFPTQSQVHINSQQSTVVIVILLSFLIRRMKLQIMMLIGLLYGMIYSEMSLEIVVDEVTRRERNNDIMEEYGQRLN